MTSVISFSQKDDTVLLKTVNVYSHLKQEESALSKKTIDSTTLAGSANTSLSDLLSGSLPVFIKSHGRGALSTVSVRGTAPAHTDVMWNGMSMKSPMLGQVDLSLIPSYIIDEVYMLSGASTVQDAGGALGGSINILNEADWNNKFSGKYIQGVGSYQTFNEFFQLNTGNSKIQSKTRIYHNYSKNNFSFKNKNIADIDPVTGEYIYPEQTNDNADYKYLGGLQEIYYRPSVNSVFSAKYWYQQSERSLPRLNTYEGNDYSNINKQEENTHSLIGEWKYFGIRSRFIISSGLINRDMLYYLKNYISGHGFENAIYSESSCLNLYNKASYKYEWHENLFVADYSFNKHNVNTLDTVSDFGYNKSRNEHSAYFAVFSKIGKKINITARVRQEMVSGKLAPFIPSAGFDYKIDTSWNHRLKINIARNYRQPALNDLYWQPGGNINLKPEKGYCLNLDISSEKKKSKYSFGDEISLYYSEINDWIIWIPSTKGYWSPENISRVIAKGLEYNLKGSFILSDFRFTIASGYALTRSINYGDTTVWGRESWGKQLPFIPVHSFNFNLSVSKSGFTLAWSNNSYSERFTTSTNNITLRDWLYPYYMNNLSIEKGFNLKKSKLNLQIKIYNLFNEEYRSVLGRPMPGRNFVIQLMYRF
ncbi:MAG: hypothetical protein A2W91_04145 [Bacteroidetes bacterium GWF2_38_335]|nr:MAG: hypothetical protein A2W91_04145 [Bacteroidetes bacterium GWF2_38_335]OFY79142.1 MAG: hypothetical protein A2281_03480 [Bacteroidetes bacterium RIFOXYA12_FULL_38_20]